MSVAYSTIAARREKTDAVQSARVARDRTVLTRAGVQPPVSPGVSNEDFETSCLPSRVLFRAQFSPRGSSFAVFRACFRGIGLLLEVCRVRFARVSCRPRLIFFK